MIADTNGNGSFADETAVAIVLSNEAKWSTVDAAPALVIADPVITKSVNPAFSVPGESVVWTITVSNPGSVPINNVVVSDDFPAEVEILSVNTTMGTAATSGQNVTVRQAVLAGNQTITIQVNAQVRKTAKSLTDIVNTALLDFDGGTQRKAQATLHLLAKELPATGEHPADPLQPTGSELPFALGAVALLLALVAWQRRKS